MNTHTHPEGISARKLPRECPPRPQVSIANTLAALPWPPALERTPMFHVLLAEAHA